MFIYSQQNPKKPQIFFFFANLLLIPSSNPDIFQSILKYCLIFIPQFFLGALEKLRTLPRSSIWKLLASFDVQFLYANISIFNPLNIIKDYTNNDHEFIWRLCMQYGKLPDFAYLILTTTWRTFDTHSFTHKLMVQQLQNNHLKPQHKYVCKLRRKSKHLLY